jgi:hypothetical protein
MTPGAGLASCTAKTIKNMPAPDTPIRSNRWV